MLSLNPKSKIRNLKLLACQLEDRKLDGQIDGILKCNPHAVADLYVSDALAHKAALDNHAFIQNDADVANRRFLFECGIARHPYPGKTVDSSRSSSRHPIQITAETVHANNPW